jgi:hypothetical protein
MACCGKRKAYTQQNPLILGDPVGEAVEVIASVSVMGMKPNQVTWVKGSHLQSILDSGWVRLA